MSEDQSYQPLKDAIEAGDLDKVKEVMAIHGKCMKAQELGRQPKGCWLTAKESNKTPTDDASTGAASLSHTTSTLAPAPSLAPSQAPIDN